jgi:hypothetical protein
LIKSIAAQWRSVNWKLLTISVIIQLITWWYVPISYAAKISTATFQIDLVFFALYSLLVAGSAHLILNSNFNSRFALLPILASFLFSFSGVVQGKLVVLLLLLLAPAFLLVLYFPQLEMQNMFGLIIYSIIFATCIPASIVFLTAHFLSWTFIVTLGSYWLSYLFFLSPVFMHDNTRNFRIFSTIIGIAFIIWLLIQSISITHIVAIVIIIASWFVMHSMPNMADKFVKYSTIQAILILLLYI